VVASPVFDPSRYLTTVNGNDYLEVKWRLAWLRSTHPDAVISTELVRHDDGLAIFRASVTLAEGGAATGYGSEGADDFRDYIEKAETKAIGRALAALGFGTQFCPDFEFGAAAGKVVDAPIDFASTKGRRRASAVADPPARPDDRSQGATDRQLKFIQAIARETGLDEHAIDREAELAYGVPVPQLGRRDASAFIERLQARRQTAELAS
jgi:hypothetical protein